MQTKWYKNFREAPNSKLRMFCFPHAGGSAQDYRKWYDYLPSDVELLVAQMPGRAERIQEKLCTNLTELIDHFCSAIISFLDKPYILVGHSLGGSIAFEVAKAIRKHGCPLPQRLFIIGRSSPTIPELSPKYNLSDEAFIDYLKMQSGTNEKIFNDKEILKFFLPIIRNDIRLADTYHDFYKKESPLSCPIHVFYGSKEVNLNRKMVEEWQSETSSDFSIDQFEGHHFFLHEQAGEVMNKIFKLECATAYN